MSSGSTPNDGAPAHAESSDRPVVVELEDITRRFDDTTTALDSISLQIREGETLALVGPSGSGKTTIVRLVNGLERPDAGRVLIDGTDLTELDLVAHRRRTGYVIQQVGLLPHWSVERNVATVPRLLGWSPTKTATAVDRAIADADLPPGLRTRYPHELSGGEQQRVGIARALAASPRLLLMDEPFGALDVLTRRRLQRLLVKLRKERALTTLLVTHDLLEAAQLADRVAVLRAGRLVTLGPSASIAQDPDPWVREFFALASQPPGPT